MIINGCFNHALINIFLVKIVIDTSKKLIINAICIEMVIKVIPAMDSACLFSDKLMRIKA